MIKTIYREVATSGTTQVDRHSCLKDAEYVIRVPGKELCDSGVHTNGYRYPTTMTEPEARDLYNCLHEFFGEKTA